MTPRPLAIINSVFVLLVTIFLAAHPAVAQEFRATVSGTIKDASGSPIPGATVTATNGEVKVAAISNADSDSYTFVISITLAIGAAGGGARSDADVAGYTKARLLSGASVSAGGAVTVSSNATSRSHAKGEGW